MKKALLALAAVAALPGCSFKFHGIPGAPLPFASVDYTVLGETSAEACGTYIFGIDFGHLFVDNQGSTAGGGATSIAGLISSFIPSGNAEIGRAMYDALEKMPEATNLYAARTHTSVDGIAPYAMPIFAKRCARVVAHGVKLGKGPVPNAN